MCSGVGGVIHGGGGQVVWCILLRFLQEDTTSCGWYLSHYWEGEVRQFLGQGWVVGRPIMETIKKMRTRHITISTELVKFIELEKEKKKPKKIEEKVEFPEDGPRCPAAHLLMEFLQKEAARSLDTALVEFFGCSKCRFSRTGCINWQCNPEKFKALFLLLLTTTTSYYYYYY